MSKLELIGSAMAFLTLLSLVVLALWRSPSAARRPAALSKGAKRASFLVAASGRSKL